MVTNYRRGYDIERKAMELLKELGCPIAHRTAGSHSMIDVFGYCGNSVYFVQLKRMKEPRPIEKTLKQYEPPSGMVGPNIYWMVWFWIDRHGWDFYIFDKNAKDLPVAVGSWVRVKRCSKSDWGFVAYDAKC